MPVDPRNPDSWPRHVLVDRCQRAVELLRRAQRELGGRIFVETRELLHEIDTELQARQPDPCPGHVRAGTALARANRILGGPVQICPDCHGWAKGSAPAEAPAADGDQAEPESAPDGE